MDSYQVIAASSEQTERARRMDPVDNIRATAEELLCFAQQEGIDLRPHWIEGNFQKDRRWIFLWRKDETPSSGPANVKKGTLQYNMQGARAVLPDRLKDSASAFRGMWTEAGTLENIEQAYELVKAWLIDGKEVDYLPQRQFRRYGI
jgi:hypothetical protein